MLGNVVLYNMMCCLSVSLHAEALGQYLQFYARMTYGRLIILCIFDFAIGK